MRLAGIIFSRWRYCHCWELVGECSFRLELITTERGLALEL